MWVLIKFVLLLSVLKLFFTKRAVYTFFLLWPPSFAFFILSSLIFFLSQIEKEDHLIAYTLSS